MVKQNSMKFPMGIPGSICLWESSHWPLVVRHPVTPGSLEIIPELHWWWLESWQMFNNGKVETQCFLVGGWAYPSEKVWFRQLGWWHSQLNGKITFMFQSTKQFFLQSNFIHIIASFLGHHHCDSKWQVILELPYGFPVWRPHRLRNRWVRNRRDSHPPWLSRDTSHCATSVPLCLAWLQQKKLSSSFSGMPSRMGCVVIKSDTRLLAADRIFGTVWVWSSIRIRRHSFMLRTSRWRGSPWLPAQKGRSISYQNFPCKICKTVTSCDIPRRWWESMGIHDDVHWFRKVKRQVSTAP